MPNWRNTIDISDLWAEIEQRIGAGDDKNGELEYDEYGEKISERIRALDMESADVELTHILDTLSNVDCVDEFDDAMDMLYSWGDVNNRLWIKTI